MRKLSKKEWIAASLAVVFVSYTLFGADIMRLFNRIQINKNQSASVINSNNQEVIINDVVLGSGIEAESGKLLTVHYVLTLQDGTVLQSSKDFGQPFQFLLGAGQVISGWDIGLQNMKVGGIRTLIIPPHLAYGDKQVGSIPANSTLIFTVELLDVQEVSPELVQ